MLNYQRVSFFWRKHKFLDMSDVKLIDVFFDVLAIHSHPVRPVTWDEWGSSMTYSGYMLLYGHMLSRSSWWYDHSMTIPLESFSFLIFLPTLGWPWHIWWICCDQDDGADCQRLEHLHTSLLFLESGNKQVSNHLKSQISLQVVQAACCCWYARAFLYCSHLLTVTGLSLTAVLYNCLI